MKHHTKILTIVMVFFAVVSCSEDILKNEDGNAGNGTWKPGGQYYQLIVFLLHNYLPKTYNPVLYQFNSINSFWET